MRHPSSSTPGAPRAQTQRPQVLVTESLACVVSQSHPAVHRVVHQTDADGSHLLRVCGNRCPDGGRCQPACACLQPHQLPATPCQLPASAPCQPHHVLCHRPGHDTRSGVAIAAAAEGPGRHRSAHAAVPRSDDKLLAHRQALEVRRVQHQACVPGGQPHLVLRLVQVHVPALGVLAQRVAQPLLAHLPVLALQRLEEVQVLVRLGAQEVNNVGGGVVLGEGLGGEVRRHVAAALDVRLVERGVRAGHARAVRREEAAAAVGQHKGAELLVRLAHGGRVHQHHAAVQTRARIRVGRHGKLGGQRHGEGGERDLLVEVHVGVGEQDVHVLLQLRDDGHINADEVLGERLLRLEDG
mmetsp:Transcript_32533/g.82648  ORF Transcript_32533/g.82648 Transcript_32533/m.82648 type:complete len:354 (+) Transcript_32533:262-1323(+)